LAGTSSCTKEEIVQAYIAPLRSAILVDDGFPRYEQLVNAEKDEESPWIESKTAARVVNMCHRRSLICDIENRSSDLLSKEQLERITKSDLVVLDYHLTPKDDADVLPALAILDTLAETHHANLVIVYTKYDLNKALRDVFVRFRGIDQSADFPSEYDATDLSEWDPEFDADTLFKHLAGDRDALKNLIAKARDDLRRSGVDQKHFYEVVKAGVELWLRKRYRHVGAPNRADALDITRSADDVAVPWIQFKNVFVAFVSKLDESTDLIDALENALLAWNPGVVRIILSYARSRMQQRGFTYEQVTAGAADQQIGLLYHALESEEPDETVRLRDMLRRLFDSVRRELASDSATFGAEIIHDRMSSTPVPPNSTADEKKRYFIERAREMTRESDSQPVGDEQVIASLNAFLCSRDFDASHLWAGTVFLDESSKNWWVCVAPTCEIVPRTPKSGTWQRDLHPSLPMLALRLEVTKKMSVALNEATQGKHIFVRGPNGVVALRVLDAIAGHPRPETLILQDEGRVDADQKFRAYAIVKGAAGEPALDARTFRVIAQLRSEYADRFLHQTGHHTSRIGVDFVSLGEPEKITEDVGAAAPA